MNDDARARVVYEEIGRVHRYFLNWRYGLLAGHITIIGTHAVAYAWLASHASGGIYKGVVFVSAILVTLLFWGFETRTRDLYRACLDIGEAWENTMGVKGAYTKLNNLGSRFSHSSLIKAYFIGVLIAIALLVIAALLAMV